MEDAIEDYGNGKYFCKACVVEIYTEKNIPCHVGSRAHWSSVRRPDNPPLDDRSYYCGECRCIVLQALKPSHDEGRDHLKNRRKMEVNPLNPMVLPIHSFILSFAGFVSTQTLTPRTTF